VVKLTSDERTRLEGIKRGREAAYRRRHAEVLLLVDEGQHGSKLIDREVAERTGFHRCTVEQIRERCVTEGLDSALERKNVPVNARSGWMERVKPDWLVSPAAMPPQGTPVGHCIYYRKSLLSWTLLNPSLMNASAGF
jgi:hypothetical protein